MLNYFNRKIAYKIIRRSIIVLALFILFISAVAVNNKRAFAVALACIVESIWVFFNLKFEIVSRFVLTLLIGLLLIFDHDILLYTSYSLDLYIVIFEIILVISIIYYVKEHKYKNITLSNIEDTILK